MGEFTPEIAERVVATCAANVGDAAEALSRAFDGEFEVAVGEAGPLGVATRSEELKTPGLAIVLTYGNVGAAAILSEATNLLPDWCAAPDATGKRKLAALAQELGMLIVPGDFFADSFVFVWVDNLQNALEQGGVADDAAVVPLKLTCGDKTGVLHFVWPLGEPANVVPAAVGTEPKPVKASAPTTAPPMPAKPPPSKRGVVSGGGDFGRLPSYAKSLLKIEVPVVVNLAKKKLPLREILELGPGSIVKFNKSCDEALEMCVGDRQIAEGEAVKVGDKFGLRISTIALPDERFKPVPPRRGKPT